VDESNADLALPDEASAVERRARQLACRVCTYAVTGSNFTDQHWYYCYTCGLTQSEGCCSVCIRVCHAGHVVSYSRRSRFFCDCGAGGLASRGVHCKALSPRRYVPQPQSRVAAGATGSAPTAAPAAAPAAASSRPAAARSAAVTTLPPPSLTGPSRLALLRCMAESSFVTVVFGAYEWLLSLAQAEERAAAAVGIAASEPDLFPVGESARHVVAPASGLASLRLLLRPGA